MTEDFLAETEDGAYNAASPKEIKKAKSAAKIREEQLRSVTVNLLSTRSGREWLWAILSDTHAFRPRITVAGTEYEIGFFNGEREVGLRLQRLLCRSDPGKFGLLVQENDKE